MDNSPDPFRNRHLISLHGEFKCVLSTYMSHCPHIFVEGKRARIKQFLLVGDFYAYEDIFLLQLCNLKDKRRL